MKIAVEATGACRAARTGVGHYTINLVDALLSLAPEAGDQVELCYRLSRWKRRQHRYLPAGIRTRWIQEPVWPLFKGVDVVHGTDARVPAWRSVARVASLHDVFSLLFKEFAEASFHKRIQEAYRRLARRCHRIITSSASTKEDFLRFVEFPPECIDVVHLGVGPAFHPRSREKIAPTLARYKLTRDYLLYVGELSSRKNIPALLTGFANSRAAASYQLVLVGGMSFEGSKALAELQRLRLESKVRLLGYVPEEHVPDLYSGAAAFVFPTHYEGFGLPVIEALASGVPVVAGNKGSVPEFAGEHAVMVDPTDVGAIAEGIDVALATPGAAREAARLHATTFTWERCARETRRVYERALSSVRATT